MTENKPKNNWKSTSLDLLDERIKLFWFSYEVLEAA